MPVGPTLAHQPVSWAPCHDGGDLTATPDPSIAADHALLAQAFRDLHGTRLHGFALLVALGDHPAAERVAGAALAAGAQQAASLRHPERAAAWLRARTLRALPRRVSHGTAPVAERRAALAALGVDDTVYRGLAALGIEARAALVASAIERFEPIDIETILGAAPAATRHMIAKARHRYVRVAGTQPAGDESGPLADQEGGLVTRVREVAARAMSRGNARR